MSYFVFYRDLLYCFYYGTDRSIYQRVYKDGKWSKAVCIVSDVRKMYSVMLEGELCIICQESSGNIILCYQKDDVWETGTILEGRGIDPPNMRMTRIGDAIIYNLPNNREHTLILQQQNNGKWEKSVMIDGFIPFGNCIYRLSDIGDGRKLLIYRRNMPEQRIGFRIIDKSGNIGDFKTIYASNSLVTDCSFVRFDNMLHFIVAVKGRFASRLVYIQAAEQAAENGGTVLWEGNNIEAASIRHDEGRIIVSHSTGNRLYTFISGESGFRGTDFKRISGPQKKAYIINGKNSSDIIVPYDRPYDIDISLLN